MRTTISNTLKEVREKAPLVHNITNFVVMNNTANALLAMGASPVMAHAVEEVEEMANLAAAVVLNMGTLSPLWVEAMLLAGQKAYQKGTPVVFDPVGVGATSYRTKVAAQIIQHCHPTIIRGNASEIMALCDARVKTKGVDSTTQSLSAIESAKLLAAQTGAVVVVSGETDLIVHQKQLVMLHNGSTLMPSITGMGCTATAIIGAMAGVEKDPFKAAVAGMAYLGVAGEIATERAKGPGSLQMHLLDVLFTLREEELQKRLKIDEKEM